MHEVWSSGTPWQDSDRMTAKKELPALPSGGLRDARALGERRPESDSGCYSWNRRASPPAEFQLRRKFEAQKERTSPMLEFPQFPKASRNQDLPYSLETTFLLKTKVVRRQGTLTSSGSVTRNMHSQLRNSPIPHKSAAYSPCTRPQPTCLEHGTQSLRREQKEKGRKLSPQTQRR